MIKISPYTPLFFRPSKDGSSSGSRYVQTFASTDRILIELMCGVTDVEPKVSVCNQITGENRTVSLNRWAINSDIVLYYYVLYLLPNGFYKVNVNGSESEMFCVTDREDELQDTVLIQYSNKGNRSTRDAVFFIDNAQFFFDFRVPGGFMDNGWTFEADSEQFVTPDSDIVTISSTSSTQKVLTIGTHFGCPIWFGELVNRLLCCDYVYVDEVRFARKESSVPEVTEVLPNSRSFVFKQLLQEVRFLDPSIENVNKMQFRKAIDDMRTVDSTTKLRIS